MTESYDELYIYIWLLVVVKSIQHFSALERNIGISLDGHFSCIAHSIVPICYVVNTIITPSSQPSCANLSPKSCWHQTVTFYIYKMTECPYQISSNSNNFRANISLTNSLSDKVLARDPSACLLDGQFLTGWVENSEAVFVYGHSYRYLQH